MSVVTSNLPFNSRAQRTGDSPIAGLMKKTVEDPEILSLAAGFVDQPTLPNDLMKKAIDDLFSESSTAQRALQYGITPGLRDLRLALAARLEKLGIENVDPECIVISNGGQQSLFTVTETMVDVGDVVLVEDPTYFVYMDVLNAAGAKVMGVSTDEEGMVPEALEARLKEIKAAGLRDRLKILYVMSYYANPKGCNMSEERRRKLYEIYTRECDANGQFLLIEDASYRDLYLEGKDEPYIKSFDKNNELVFTQGTFSKAFAPGLRLGWSYMPPSVHQAVCRQKACQDFGSSNMNQSLMANLLKSGSYEVAAERFRDRYRKKRDVMINALKEYWPDDTDILYPFGGLYVWVSIPGIDTDPGSEFLNKVLEKKVLYVPGYYCFCEDTQEPKPTNSMRLCYGSVGIDEMPEALKRMGEVIKAMR